MARTTSRPIRPDPNGCPGRLRAHIQKSHIPVWLASQEHRRKSRTRGGGFQAIPACRTAALGGHTEAGDHCGTCRIASNACRTRHGPTDQPRSKARWLAARRAARLPIEEFHVGFTLRPALNALAQGDPRVLSALLRRAASDTLTAFDIPIALWASGSVQPILSGVPSARRRTPLPVGTRRRRPSSLGFVSECPSWRPCIS